MKRKNENINYDRYKGFSAEDLLLDDYFIDSMTNPTVESDTFWKKVVHDGILSYADYQQACYLFDSIQVQPDAISGEEINHLWENIHHANHTLKLAKKKKRNYFLFWTIGSVASFFLLFFAYIELTSSTSEPDISSAIEQVVAPTGPVTDVQLILANNELITFDEKEVDITYDDENIAVNDTKLKNQTQTNESVVYNQLIVPKGKRSTLTFGDGSKIWINAGTRVVYPVAFAGSEREIYVDGEVFLDISRDENRPFIVKSKEFQVEVLGTSFNFMAYESDDVHHVVLVSGTVKVRSESTQEAVLSPSDMFLYENSNSSVQKVNVNDYISWKTGMYQYKSERLDVIMKRLSRYYGEEIACEPEVAHLKCTGKLDLKDDLNVVLKGITQTAPINYKKENERYVIVNK